MCGCRFLEITHPYTYKPYTLYTVGENIDNHAAMVYHDSMVERDSLCSQGIPCCHGLP